MSGERRSVKRLRIDASGPGGRKPPASRIFAPYRTIGLVSPTEVPFTSQPAGKTTFQILTSAGRCLHTYDLRRGLHLTFITQPQTPALITATLAWQARTLAAWGGPNCNGVWVFHRGKHVASLGTPPGLDEPILQLIGFGTWIVGCCASRMEVWKSGTYEHYTTIFASGSTHLAPSRFTGHVCHMPTLLNKILAGKDDGSIEIWNLSTRKLIYTLLPEDMTSGSITALEPTPVIYLVAAARDNGTVTIHDVRADKELLVLNRRTSQSSPITTMSFRTDDLGAGQDGRKAGVLATATSESGDVTLWDLNEGGRVMGVLYNAHNPPSTRGDVPGGITRVEFLAGQAVLVTTGQDNALRTWIFDEVPFSPVPRPLHDRSGHAGGITQLNFLPHASDDSVAEGKWLLSAGRDHGLWGWSLRRDGQSSELSQGNIRKKHRKMGHVLKGLDNEIKTGVDELKAPEITCMATCMNRDGGMNTNTGGGPVWMNTSKPQKKDSNIPDTGWESIVTGHRGDKHARTWFWGRKKAGRWAFPTSDGTEVSSVAMSPCGTFALIGSDGGTIDMFNLQSGIQRQQFPAPLTPAQARKLKQRLTNGSENHEAGRSRHTQKITGIMVDSLNRTVISTSLDGRIKFWDFRSGTLRHEVNWHPMTGITSLRYHRSSDLIALSCDDLSIRVVDIETRRLVRELWGCVGQIRDYVFSNDGRWIIAASADSVIRVWDLPTGHLIDAMQLEGTCTALAFSVTGEYLATAHANSIGIHLWSNKTLFMHVPTRQIAEADVRRMALPSASGEGGEGLFEAAFDTHDLDEDREVDDLPAATVDQLASDLTTLSLVPRSRWQTLLHLDVIRARNKPIEAPKAPEKAPFFLPSVDKLSKMKQIEESNGLEVTEIERSRIAAIQRRSQTNQPFNELLHASNTNTNVDSTTSTMHEPFIAHLASLAPPAADLEIRSLQGPSDEGFAYMDDNDAPANERVLFVHALTARLQQKRDFELVQAWMAVFLRLHGDTVPLDEELRAALAAWREVQQREADRLGRLAGYIGGVLGFVRSAR